MSLCLSLALSRHLSPYLSPLPPAHLFIYSEGLARVIMEAEKTCTQQLSGWSPRRVDGVDPGWRLQSQEPGWADVSVRVWRQENTTSHFEGSQAGGGAAVGACLWSSLVLPCSPAPWGNWLHTTAEWPLEDSILVPTGHGSPESYKRLESAANILCFSFHCADSQIQKAGVGMGAAPLTMTLSDPLAKFLLPAPMILCCAGIEVLVPKGGMLAPEDTTMIPLNWELRLPLSHFELLVPLNQQAEKGITVLAYVTWLMPRRNWTVTPQWL